MNVRESKSVGILGGSLRDGVYPKFYYKKKKKKRKEKRHGFLIRTMAVLGG